MALTFDEHKTAVDLEFPTPSMTWYLHRDDPRHSHDDAVIAYVVMTTVDGGVDRYEAYGQRSGDGDRWHAVSVRDTEGPRSRPGHTTYATFPLLQAALAASFETLNESARWRIASELYARDLVDDLGIGFEPAPVADASTATLAGIATLRLTGPSPRPSTATPWPTPSPLPSTSSYRLPPSASQGRRCSGSTGTTPMWGRPPPSGSIVGGTSSPSR